MATDKKTENILPTVMSFFLPGLGQLMKQQWGKGVAMMISYFLSFILLFFLIGFITLPLVWIWSLVDAYND